jgi:flagellum-specific peptidoglycan hydrolase FlgJ
MTPKDFINAIAPAACESAKKTKIPASFVIAEAAIESGWGTHAPGMNLFGVKADKSWTGPFTVKRTREVIHGESVFIDDKFRSYSDWLGSIQDHADFLLMNPRYKPAFQCSDAESFTRAIAAAGYATDLDYASKIIHVIRSRNLTQYDKGLT